MLSIFTEHILSAYVYTSSGVASGWAAWTTPLYPDLTAPKHF